MRTFLLFFLLKFFIGIVILSLAPSSPLRNVESILLDQGEYLQLKQIYDLAGGRHWKWKSDYAKYGVPWIFGNATRNNPCRVYWQGLSCLPPETNQESGNIFSIELTSMNLNGILPEIIGNFTKLKIFLVGENQLHGQIPQFLNTPDLLMVNFSYNSFSGQVPDNFLNESYQIMNLIYLSNNYLTGTIPNVIYTFKNLEYLNLYNNSFYGTLSSNIGTLTKLFYLNVGSNKLHGTLPSNELYQLKRARQIFLDTNDFTGKLPERLSPWIDVLWLSTNYFTGTIPSYYCTFSNITVLKIDYNYLTGQLPKCGPNSLPLLYILQVQDNQLTGPLTNFFSPEAYRYLSVLDLSDNAFSGSFPTKVFQLPSLKSLAAVKNCFVGQIPESICDEGQNLTSSLQVVALDGLHASSYCITHYWSPFRSSSSTGSFSTLMSGSLPCCLWRLPNITTLHFSGNGFTGTMPQFSSDLSKSLHDVSISHNRLKGTIPDVILDHAFTNLDLSYNKLYGSIENFAHMPFSSDPTTKSTGAALNLENNRLSGRIPKVLENAFNVQILEGNIFDCDSKVPSHDPSAENYMCGSNELDSASIVFTVSITAVIVTVGIVILSALLLLKPFMEVDASTINNKSNSAKKQKLLQSQQLRQVQYEKFVAFLKESYEFLWYTYACLSSIQENIVRTYLHPYTCDESQINLLKYLNVYQFLYSLFLIQKISFFIAFFTIFFCSPIYILYYYIDEASPFCYSKYSDKYSWISTSVLLTGDAPAITLIIVWYLLIIVVLIMIYYHYHIHYRKVTTWKKFKSFFGSMDETTMNQRGSSSIFFSPATVPPVDATSQEKIRESAVALLEGHDDEEEGFEDKLALLSNTSFNRISECVHHGATAGEVDLLTNNNNPVNTSSTTRESLNNTTRISFLLDTPGNYNTSPVPGRFSTSFTNRVSFNNSGKVSRNNYSPLPQREESRGELRPSITNRKSFLSFFSFSHRSEDDRQSLASSSQYSMLQIVGDRLSDLVRRRERFNQCKYYVLYITIFLINVVVGVTMNAVYLLVEDSDSSSSSTKEFMQVFMAFFKLFWNIIVIRMMINLIQPYRRSVTRLHVFMLIFNSILAPCIATAFTDSSCFKDVFSVSEAITASYEIATCTESTQAVNPSTGKIFTTCTRRVSLLFQTAFTPTFIYYYSCGAKLLTAYIPVFIYTYTILLVASIFLYTTLSNIDLNILPSFIANKIDGVLRPKEAGGSIIFERLIKGHSIQALLTQHIIVLLTFGVNSPILATIMGFTISVNCAIWQIMIIRYVKHEAHKEERAVLEDTVTFKPVFKEIGKKKDVEAATSKIKKSSIKGVVSPIHQSVDERKSPSPSFAQANERISELTDSNNSLLGEILVEANLSNITEKNKVSNTVKKGSLSSGLTESTSSLTKIEENAKEEDEEEEEIIFPSNNSSLHSWDSTEFFRCTKDEENRLNELNTVIDDAWMCIYHTRWLIVYVSLFFYMLILYDVAGDQESAIHALWVPSVVIGLILITRLCIMDVLKYVQETYL